MTKPTPAELIERSNCLGSDLSVTNYAGGNTSATGTDVDLVTCEQTSSHSVRSEPRKPQVGLRSRCRKRVRTVEENEFRGHPRSVLCWVSRTARHGGRSRNGLVGTKRNRP